MRIVVPKKFEPMPGTTVPENDAPAWEKAKAYKAGDMVLSKHFVYRAVMDNTGVEPITSYIGTSAKWQPVTTSNLYKCQTLYTYEKTVAPASSPEEMTFVLPWAAGSTTLALLGLEATHVSAKIVDLTGTTRLDDSKSMRKTITTWTDYLFGKRRYMTAYISDYITPFAGTLTLTIKNIQGTAKVGKIIMGRAEVFGETLSHDGYGKTEYGSSVEPYNYSTQEIDQDLGTVTFVRRYIADKANIKITTRPDDVNEVGQILKEVMLEEGALFIADNNISGRIYSLIIFGFIKTPPMTFATCGQDTWTIRIEGIA